MICLEISLLSQICIFFCSLIFGLVLGIVFGLFRIFDIVTGASLKQVFIEDILYFIIVGVLTFLFMLVVNKGEFRVYIIFGELIGFSLYHFTLGKLAIKVLAKFIYFLKGKITDIKVKLEKPIHNFALKVKKLPLIDLRGKILKIKKIN